MASRIELKRRWQQLLGDAVPDRGIHVRSVEAVRMWSVSTVLKLHVHTSTGEARLYAKKITPRQRTQARVYEFAAAEPRFPAPHAFVISSVHSNVRTGAAAPPSQMPASDDPHGEPDETGPIGDAWLVTEMARGVRLADAPPQAWQQSAALLASFHEHAATLKWANSIAGLPDLGHLPDLARRAMDTTKLRYTEGVYSGLDGARLDLVTTELLSAWQSIARRLERMPSTLVHGDCHSGNIFLSSEGLQLIDWDSAARAPGMLDLVALVDVAHRMRELACGAAALRSAYWRSLSADTRSRYGSIEECWAALRVVRALLEL